MLSADDRDLVAHDIEAYLDAHQRKDLLRLLTCGSVDDGKSTLIGRLLFDSKQIYEDQLASLEDDSAKVGTTGGTIDYALLLDGLKAEREQGITIDVAYRFFSTRARKFIIADTPGHEQYTRNMATGASTSNLAILLVDARHGVSTQTRRHSFIVSLLGIKHAVIAINKMDLVDYDRAVYERICDDYRDFSARLDIQDVRFIPISALEGDNVIAASPHTPWYRGPSMLDLLESVHIASDRNLIDFRLPVQYVKRPHLDFRGFAGTVASGVVRPGDEIVVLPSGKRSRVAEVLVHGETADAAAAGLATTITLTDEIDVSRGDIIAHPGNLPHLSRDLDAMLVWMDDQPLRPGASYLIKTASTTMPCQVEALRYRIDINTLRREEDAAGLELNDIGRARIGLTRPLAFDPYRKNRQTGGFILIDRGSNATVAAGMIIDRGDRGAKSAVDQADTVVEAQASRVSAADRATKLGHGAACVWLTGLPKAGKTTIAYALEERLATLGVTTGVIDSRRLRSSLNNDLGYSPADRSENIRRLAHLARLQCESGLVAILAAVAPFAADREAAAALIGDERFVEVHVAAGLDACRARDDEGVYGPTGPHRRAEDLLAMYEVPDQPALRIDERMDVEAAATAIIAELQRRGIIAAR